MRRSSSPVTVPNTDFPTVIITGASSGVGLYAPKSMSDRGWFVVMACRDLAKAAHAAQQVGIATERLAILAGAALRALRRADAGRAGLGRRRLPPANAVALAGAIVLASVWALLSIGVPVDRYVFNVRPEAVRLPLIAVLFASALPYSWPTSGSPVVPARHPAPTS